ncbi:hypothetical protein F4859DRAFT_506812 [Xylaria cf. heliscus]|nr:hypothetical protein F4859DRAFT_506812 [Xylaria cf. heliscus]
MHRRNSTNPRRLDRRKSATSVKSVHLEHIPPETAERDAQVAATQAFARARARSATDSNSSLWPPPQTPFHRQQSIRFVQPSPPKLASNTTMAQGTPTSYRSHTSKHVTNIEHNPCPSSSGAAGDYINTLFSSDEYYTPQDDIASMPSSYRKLRKSRSMFTNRATMSGPEHPNLSKSSASANQLPLPANSYFHPLRGNENIPPRKLKAPKSMSFLRDLRGSFVNGFKSEQDTAQLTPTNGYSCNQDRTKHNLRSKPSKIFSSKASMPEKAFRKSMRDTSNGIDWMDTRRVSQGLKHKLKNLFSLGKGDTDDTGLPLQYVDAQKSHNFGFGGLQQETDDVLRRASSADQAALSHVASGIPSLHAVPSMESLRSEQKTSDERSRVTSWSNSDTNTRERKRLSIINEHGAHVCSSSAQFMSISEQSNASSASLNQPVQAAPGARIDQSRQELTNSLERQDIPQRKSSLRLRRPRDAAATIRYKNDKPYPKSSRPTPNTAKAKKERQVYPASTPTSRGEDVLSKKKENEILSTQSAKEVPVLIPTLSSRSSAFFGSPTRHLFRTQSPYRRALQDRMHTTTNEQPVKSPDFNPWIRSLSNLPNLQLQRSSTYGSDADIKLQYTESIYSTNTEDGQTRRQSFLSIIEDFPQPKSTHGDATIFVDQPAYNKRSSSLPPKQRVSSSSSSVEWKMWLSSNVSKLEETTKQVDSNDFQHGLRSARSSGHVRENAQINDEEEDALPDLPDTPSRVRVNTNEILDMNYDDEDDDDQPIPFDAGDVRTTIGRPQLPSVNPLTTSISASNMISSVKRTEEARYKTSIEMVDNNREKDLPQVPSLSFKENRTNRLASIPSKLVKHLPKPKNSMTSLTNRGVSGVGEAQATKINGSTSSRPKVYSMASSKPENVSPTAVSDDDPYGIEGSGVLGPTQQNMGSKRMVDIFLSSRRRRMASEDEGSVFL